MKLLLTILIALAPINLFADELETDLNGFRLQQFVDIADSQMGPPFKTFDQENSVVNAYQIDDEAYMVVGYQKKHPNNISSLQLTGFTAKALPFKGLMLGDPEKKVERTLGTPDERTKVNSPPVVALSYKDKNYTVELDNQGRLYSP